MNECDPLKLSDLDYVSKNKTDVAIIEPKTGKIKVDKLEFESGREQENSMYVESGGNHLTPLDDYW